MNRRKAMWTPPVDSGLGGVRRSTIQIVSFIYQLFGLAALCLFYFPINRDSLFLPYDGVCNLQLAMLTFRWTAPGLGAMVNPLQALGDSAIQFNHWLSPSSLTAYLIHGPGLNPVTIYTVITLEFFAAIWVLAWTLGATPRVRALAAWIGAVLVMPFVAPPLGSKFTFYIISSLVPWIIELMSETTILVACLLWLQKEQTWRAYLLALLGLLLFWHSVLTFRHAMLLTCPLVGLAALQAAAGGAFSRMSRPARFALLAGLAAAAAWPLIFVAALLLHTVPSFFNTELSAGGRMSLPFVSILFHNAYGYSWLSSPVYLAGLIGGALAWRGGHGRLRIAARMTVLYALALLTAGLSFVLVLTHYRGPTTLYFEWFLWPFLFVFSAQLVESALRRYGHRLLFPAAQRAFVTGRLCLGVPCFVFAPLLAFVFIFATSRPGDMQALRVPPDKTPLVCELTHRIALTPGGPWRGSIATFNRPDKPSVEGYTWSDLGVFDSSLWKTRGNDYRGPGLWWYDLPTLFTYNSCMRPEYYYLVTRLFASPHDTQERNVLVLTRPDARLLRLFGVRYVLSAQELPQDQYGTPVAKEGDANKVLQTGEAPSPAPLLLYELADGDKSGGMNPTHFVVESTAPGVVQKLLDPMFDPEQTAIVDEPLPGNWEKAHDVTMRWGPEGLSVTASSAGRALLVLPLLYSRCLEVASSESDRPNSVPALVRVDLALTGVVFTEQMNVTVRNTFGPLQPLCRVHDYLDAKHMGLGTRGADGWQ